jgi:hypothetical protein
MIRDAWRMVSRDETPEDYRALLADSGLKLEPW